MHCRPGLRRQACSRRLRSTSACLRGPDREVCHSSGVENSPGTPPLDPRAEQMIALFGSSAVGVATGSVDKVLEANDEMLRIFGRTRDDLAAGLSWMDAGRPADAERDAAAFDHLRRDGSTVVVKELLRPDGVGVPTLAILVATGRGPLRWVAVVVDLSGDERLKHLAWSEAAIVSTLLEDAPFGFAFIGTDLRFVRVNRELAAMNGFTVAEHDGARVFDLLPDLQETAEPLLRSVLEGGEPLRDAEIVGTTPAEPGVVHTWLESFFPVRTGDGPVLGVAAIARDVSRLRALQDELAATTLTLARALHEMQATLQPTVLPTAAGYTVTVRHLPADSDVGLGGDWYDVTRTPQGDLVASIGDVVGHGVEAIGAMARASSALRAYVVEGHAPDRALAHLDRLLGSTREAMATAAVVSVAVDDGLVRYARAGHPYPLVVDAAGSVRTLRDASGPMLGALPGATYSTAEIVLGPGQTLVLHTDGLVERRGENPAVSARRLADALAEGVSLDVEALADLVLERCVEPGLRRDDACLLLVRRDSR